MSERENEILYAEGFRTADTRVERADEELPVDEQPSLQRKRPFPIIITAQLVICVVIALGVFLLHIADSVWYDSFRSWYTAEMKKTLISRSAFEDIDLASWFSRSSPDEAAAARG